jgi:hypothetical protein
MKNNSVVSKPVKSINIDLIDFLQAKKQDTIIPKGFYCRDDISKQLNLCRSKAALKIQLLKAQDKLEVQNFKKLCNNVYRIVPHYKLKNTTKYVSLGIR